MAFMLVLGRETKLSLVELEALFGAENVSIISANSPAIAKVETDHLNLNRLGGTIKAGKILDESPSDFLSKLPAGKITLGISDYTPKATQKSAWQFALKCKNLLKRHGRNVRLIPNHDGAILSSAASHHNQLGEKINHIEIMCIGKTYAASIGTQNITAYAKRDRERPARDAFVGMLPPKLAQILINIAVGAYQNTSQATQNTPETILDPFCGTGVVLQEATLMGYNVYGTDLSEKMIAYSHKNLDWLFSRSPELSKISQDPILEQGDATSHQWKSTKIDCVASEIYLGHPLSAPPSNIKLKEYQQSTKELLKGFLKNIAPQLHSGATLCLAIPAWLRPEGNYEGVIKTTQKISSTQRTNPAKIQSAESKNTPESKTEVNILDEIEKLGYNILQYKHATNQELLYHREGQIVARQLLILRKQ